MDAYRLGMRVLVTGANGFIGTYVVRAALERGHAVHVMNRTGPSELSDSEVFILQHDLTGTEQLDLSSFSFDCVIHLAASLAGSYDEQYQSTVAGTEKLMSAVKRAGIRKVIGISSISVLEYSKLKPKSIVDESVAIDNNISGMGRYATMKLQQENVFRKHASEKLQCTILRPGLVYDDQSLLSAHAGIIKGSLCCLVNHGGEVPTVEVKGLAKAIVSAAEHDLANKTTLHITDDNLPSQSAYLAGLRRRGVLTKSCITLPWQAVSGVVNIIGWFGAKLGILDKLPEVMLPKAFASRLKPFKYSNSKAKDLLGWKPGQHFS